jgi:hypothetical protein
MGPGPERERHRLTEVLITARGAAPPQARVAPSTEHDGIGHERRTAPVVQVERERAEAGAVGDEQLRHVVLVDDRNAQLGDLGRERVQDRPTRVVARVTGASPTVGTEEPLVEATVFRPGEVASPLGQLHHGRGRFTGHDLHDSRVAEEIALRQRVGEVLLPRVLRIPGPQGGVDPPGRQHRVGVALGPFRHHDDLGSRPVSGDRRSQPRSARTDHQHVRRVGTDRHATSHGLNVTDRGRAVEGANPDGSGGASTPAVRAERPAQTARVPTRAEGSAHDSRCWSSSNGQHPTQRSERCASW